ncbi:MAG: hydroxyacid dehydrogenase [Planctomycetaceae bacterium]|nr:hydroxyacid dehydrogenase [Planctomycetaceae bacterium]
MNLHESKIVRFNCKTFPPSQFERQKYAEYGLKPLEVECDTIAEAMPLVKDAAAIIVVAQPVPELLISNMQQCRVISRLGAGTDKIDIAAASRGGILVTNVPNFCVEEQADHSFALLLACTRKLFEQRLLFLEGNYDKARELCRPLRRMSELKLGLVGFGGSAKAMARRAVGFGMEVLATRNDLTKPDSLAEQLKINMTTLDELLLQCDIISLHLPLNSDTHHLFNRSRLLAMKAGAILINTARGGIVDEDALVDILQEGHLSAAGLDTFQVIDVHSSNCTNPTHALLNLTNVVLTPHTAAFSKESSRDVSYGGIENLVAALSGTNPPAAHIVNPGVLSQSG